MHTHGAYQDHLEQLVSTRVWGWPLELEKLSRRWSLRRLFLHLSSHWIFCSSSSWDGTSSSFSSYNLSVSSFGDFPPALVWWLLYRCMTGHSIVIYSLHFDWLWICLNWSFHPRYTQCFYFGHCLKSSCYQFCSSLIQPPLTFRTSHRHCYHRKLWHWPLSIPHFTSQARNFSLSSPHLSHISTHRP